MSNDTPTVTFEEIDFDDDDDTDRKKRPDGLSETVMGFLSLAHFKLLMAVYVLFLAVSSDVFIDKVLSRIEGTVNLKTPTTKGVMIQGLALVILVMIIDLILCMGFP